MSYKLIQTQTDNNHNKIKLNPIQIGRILNIPTSQYRDEYDYPYNEYMGPIIPGKRAILPNNR